MYINFVMFGINNVINVYTNNYQLYTLIPQNYFISPCKRTINTSRIIFNSGHIVGVFNNIYQCYGVFMKATMHTSRETDEVLNTAEQFVNC